MVVPHGGGTLFGFYATLASADFLQAAPIDSVAVGECEHTLRDLSRALAGGQRWDRVAGLAKGPATAENVRQMRQTI